MNSIISMVETHGVFMSSAVTALLWYGFILDTKPRSFIRLLGFPLFHFQAIRNIRENPATFPIALCYVIILGAIIQLILPNNPYIFVVGWWLILIYELFGVTSYILRPKKTSSFLIIITIILLFVGYGAVNTILLRSYQFMNRIDFIESIYIFIGSIYIVASINLRDRFFEELESFFVFFGLIIYSFLHVLSTSMLAFGVREYFDYTLYATLTAMFFWLISIPWIRHLKFKHS